jgi:hypothetical protein
MPPKRAVTQKPSKAELKNEEKLAKAKAKAEKADAKGK